MLVNLAGQVPLLPGAAELAYLDVDDTLRQTYGYAKQGAGRGYTGVKGLNALLAVVSTQSSVPMIAAARLRKGSTTSARGAGRFVSDALITARKAGAGGVLVLRADSAFYGHDVIATAQRQDTRFSITARQDKAVRKAIASIGDQAWTTIQYTDAIFDEDSQQWISDPHVAEIGDTAFTSKPKTKHIRAKLIVRRAKDMNPNDQSELFTADRDHAVFTDSPLPMLAAESPPRARDHRAGHRRSEERAAGAPAVRALLGQQHLAGLRDGGVQPHPRRRRFGLDLRRQSHHRRAEPSDGQVIATPPQPCGSTASC